jgi:hypothetical protein
LVEIVQLEGVSQATCRAGEGKEAQEKREEGEKRKEEVERRKEGAKERKKREAQKAKAKFPPRFI